MESEAKMAYKPHREIRTIRSHSRRFSGHSDACGKPLCSCKAYQYVDESNGAITTNAPYLCRDCYEQKYGVKIPTEVDAYKTRVLGALERYAEQQDDESFRDFVYRVMHFIRNTD